MKTLPVIALLLLGTISFAKTNQQQGTVVKTETIWMDSDCEWQVPCSKTQITLDSGGSRYVIRGGGWQGEHKGLVHPGDTITFERHHALWKCSSKEGRTSSSRSVRVKNSEGTHWPPKWPPERNGPQVIGDHFFAKLFGLLVPGGGLEPPHPCGPRILSPLRLPISPSGPAAILSSQDSTHPHRNEAH